MAPKRRDVLGMGVVLAAIPTLGLAQPRKVRLGFLGGISPDSSAQRSAIDPFRQRLRELGYVEGQNLEIHFRWAEGQPERLAGLAAELLRVEPDVIVTMGPRPAIVAKNATSTVPVVAALVDDPVATGLAAEMGRPGGNVTGISSFGSELLAKRLQLLKELVPSARRVAVLINPATASRALLEPDLREFERRLALPIVLLEAGGADQFEAAFDAMKRDRVDGVLVGADATFWTHRARLHELVARHRLPSVWGGRDYLEGGGLASYQADFAEIFRRAAAMVDAVLKGAKPATMPFEQATKLDLVISQKHAKAMGITVPPALLVAADHVIE
jgi:putative ABC transport system substrate-binding protein